MNDVKWVAFSRTIRKLDQRQSQLLKLKKTSIITPYRYLGTFFSECMVGVVNDPFKNTGLAKFFTKFLGSPSLDFFADVSVSKSRIFVR